MARPGRLRTIARVWGKAVRGLFDAIASTVVGGGGYEVLDPRRKILPSNLRTGSFTANELATMALPQLRALCRKLERDNPIARAVVEGLVAQIVGTGIGLEPDHGDEQVNQAIRRVWSDHILGCDITGRRSIYDLQSEACREVVGAGEFLWRTPTLTELAQAGKVPVVVLPLECEWLAAEPSIPVSDGITTVAGVELDRWGRPIAYRLQNPEKSASHDVERVPAAEIIHGFERRRALQGRGEPWLAPVIERIWQVGDLMTAELRSAVNCASMAIVITSDNHGEPDTTEQGTPDDPAQRIGVGSVARVFPGEDVKAFSHNRPAQQIGEFLRTLRGDIASATRVDGRWLDRDYSRASYSSMRAANIDSDRLLAPVREWFGHATIGAYYLRVLPYLCVLAGVKMPKRIAYRLVPDGQAYVDPLKDAQASAAAIAAGLSTHEIEIGRKGGDRRAYWKQLAIERKEAAAMGLVIDLSGTNAPAPDSTISAAADDPTAAGEPLAPVAKQGTDA
jgi:lambda family phage portal protein